MSLDRRAFGFVVVAPGFSLRCEGVRGSFGVRSGARSEVSMSLWTGFGPFVEAPGRSIAFRSLAWWRLFGAVETSFRV